MSGAVPELRFSGFEGEWKPVKISYLLDRVSLPAEVDPSKTYKEIGVRSHGKGLFHKDPVLGKTLGSKRVFYVVPRCLVLNIVFAWEQAVALTSSSEEGFIASHRFPMFRGKLDVSSIDFLFRLFLTKKGKTLLEIASPGGAGRNKTLGQQAFLDLKIRVPSQAEQCKIAAFLEAVDAKLTALREKADGLRQFKTGLMQRLFSQELRFTREDGSDFPDWEERKLGELLSVSYGKDHKHLANGETPVFGSGGVMRHVDTALSEGPAILIGRKGTINRPLFVEGPFWTVDTMFFAKVSQDYDPGFIFALVDQVNWMKYNEATGVPSLSASSIRNVPVTVPPSLEEQEKIAAALSALDAKIAAVTDQITHMETFKKGLLQKMFV